MEGGNMR